MCVPADPDNEVSRHMAIPTLDQDGRVPPGRHPAAMPEIEDVFVERAPHPDRRRLNFDAFEATGGNLFTDNAAGRLGPVT